jgi:hypothetical protein
MIQQERDVMRHHRIGLAALALVIAAALSNPAHGLDSTENSFAGDPSITIKYLPGKYYEQQAQIAAKAKNFRRALEMYQKAGYWGNKVSQYNVGMLYINGAEGVPVDKVRGTAWLGIAAQTHVPYVDKALTDAYAGLNAGERAAAGELWKQLKPDYADAVTLDRASKVFNAQYLRDKGTINGPPEYTTITYGNFGGGGGDQAAHPVFDPTTGALQGGRNSADSHSVNAARFLSAVKDQFSDFVHVQFGGDVSVGEPESIAEHDKNAADGAVKK